MPVGVTYKLRCTGSVLKLTAGVLVISLSTIDTKFATIISIGMYKMI